VKKIVKRGEWSFRFVTFDDGSTDLIVKGEADNVTLWEFIRYFVIYLYEMSKVAKIPFGDLCWGIGAVLLNASRNAKEIGELIEKLVRWEI